MKNYRFTTGNENNKIVLSKQKIVVTNENLTDDLAEILLGMPQYAHNVELIPGRTSDVITKKKSEAGLDIQLPESIILALNEAGIDKEKYPKPYENQVSKPKNSKQLMGKK